MFPSRSNGVLRQHTLERRLFGWLLAFLLVPALLTAGVAVLIGSQSVELVGTLGPWAEVAQSGRALCDAAAPAARRDTALARAVDLHQRNLSASLTQARRWSFLGHRAAVALPWIALVSALVLLSLSLWISRRMAAELARPIGELVGWADRMGRGEPLPAAPERESEEVDEVRALRAALRTASGEIMQSQTRALEAERVRAWGEMARRIAHEMKNPLTPLRLAVHRLRAAEAAAALGEPLEVIEEETARLDDLARHFSLLGRPSAGPRSEVDICEMVTELLRSDVPGDIRTGIESAPGVPLLLAHHDALQRALRNVIRNAVEAIRGAANGRGRITASIVNDGGSIRIQIRDNGGGIENDRLDLIFEPDYTLKAGGTGLGLALARQAVAAHKGTISARNTEDGAVLEIVLPEGERTAL
jgi:nitrogen fixation/metabolism regulation signal transduction histidine kinase